ncbi:NIPSNAP family protein [Rhodopseudomonas sp. HC1]|uniref:NIPSNAP family protein n=1 Tax=Rhodopseudomonas infernalis TaxID=2897386 RepID=UPI001EE9940D|nr:NIPSNAP family protein [Rhodopseudomonas infernalis]MCG6206181.1 NIPSNAP family protein [Rhodopseudomonas infernalis]
MNDPDAKGEVLGIWRSDIGTLGQLLILRGFEAEAELRKERDRALLSANPFNCVGTASALSMDSYAGFPFLPPVRPRQCGGFYEFRTYTLKPGGLPATLAGWQAAIAPAHDYTAHLIINMYALDGPPRITHIWGFVGVDERMKLRADHYAAKLWPPKGGPEQIAQASSTIAIAEPGLPLG